MESKPVFIKQKESLVTLLIDNIPIQISTNQYNYLLEWIDRYHRYQIGMEIYPLESNIHKQYAIKSQLSLPTTKKNQEYVKEIYLKVEEISRFFKMNKLITQSEEIQNRIAFLNQEMKTLDQLFSPTKTKK